MMFTVIIVLIVALVLIGIIVNAIQQHKNKAAAERRTEVAKQKNIIDGTETALMASDSIPVSQRLLFIMQRRILQGLKTLQLMNESSSDSKERIKQLAETYGYELIFKTIYEDLEAKKK